MTKSLSGKLAVVTGASRGIGRAIAEQLLAQGAEVVGTSTKVGGDLPNGCRHEAVRLDDPASVAAFCKTVEKLAPHILINNAGVANPQTVESIEDAEFRRVHEINLVAPMAICRAALPGMKRHGWGRIVNISSIWGPLSRVARGTYASSKAALDGLSGCLAAEVASHGVLVNCVAPGFTETEMIKSIFPPDKLAALAKSVPMKRLAQPVEIAKTVVWLASAENGYVTGQNILVDGGLSRVREV
ncbi:MAG: SDR family NAD(P)-dependent oxidoreductase [Alphaproteobacteria bacterium]